MKNKDTASNIEAEKKFNISDRNENYITKKKCFWNFKDFFLNNFILSIINYIQMHQILGKQPNGSRSSAAEIFCSGISALHLIEFYLI